MGLSKKIASLKTFALKASALSLPYFRSSEEKWKARALLLAIVVLNLAAVFMLVQINDWYRVFYDALQQKDQPVFWQQLGRFGWLAFAYVIIAVYKFYLTQLLEMRWRAWMTAHYTQRWLENQAFYRMELMRFSAPAAASANGDSPDNPDQRIQEDVNLFTANSVGLSMGLLNAVVTLASFVGILWSLSGDFSFTFKGNSWNIPGFMVWMAVLYCAVGSVLTHYIGRPLIDLNFRQQRYEADFRHRLVRVREYSESIALDRGESAERSQLGNRFSLVLANYLKLLKAQKNLTWFTVGFAQAAVVFPFIIAAPRFFSGAIQLGQLMQIASAFGRVQDSLSWFVDNYDALASWRATTDRLTSFEAAMTRQDAGAAGLDWSNQAPVEGVAATNNRPGLRARDLDVALPDGTLLLAGTSLQLSAGDRVLLAGPSGSGKSTLFRTLAGIWPFASGKVQLPPDSMFIPQRPYFPNGSLRAALAYPQEAAGYNDAALRQALLDAELPDLTQRLDDVDAWSQKLSGGEQQRLAIARVLLKAPRWVFADEATSALDAATEQSVYQRLAELTRRTGGALVSIAHSTSIQPFHNRRWTLTPAPDGSPARYQLQVAAINPAPAP